MNKEDVLGYVGIIAVLIFTTLLVLRILGVI